MPQVQVTREQADAYLKQFKQQIENIDKTLPTNQKALEAIQAAHNELVGCLPCGMSNIAAVVTAIARGLDVLLVAQVEQLKLMGDGLKRDRDAAEKQAKAIELQMSGLVIPGRVQR